MHVLGVKDLYCNERTHDDEVVLRRTVEILNVQIPVTSTMRRKKEVG